MEANWFGIIIGIIGLLSLIYNTRATRIRNESEAEKEREILEARTAAKRAEMELKERDRLFEMIKGLTDQNKEQTKQGADFLNSLGKIEKEKETDYQTLKNINDSNTQMVISELQKAHGLVIAEIRTLDTTIQTSKNNWIETVAAEFAAVLASKFNEQMMLQTQYPFPSSSDVDWAEDFVKPIVNHAWLYNRPFASENTRSPVELKSEGENLELIRGWKKDWIAVRFTRSNKAVFGWVQEHEVRIGVPAVRLATGENTIPSLNPASATI